MLLVHVAAAAEGHANMPGCLLGAQLLSVAPHLPMPFLQQSALPLSLRKIPVHFIW